MLLKLIMIGYVRAGWKTKAIGFFDILIGMSWITLLLC